MFPARAGMSRAGLVLEGGGSHVPRASGDEPGMVAVGGMAKLCSPRERG